MDNKKINEIVKSFTKEERDEFIKEVDELVAGYMDKKFLQYLGNADKAMLASAIALGAVAGASIGLANALADTTGPGIMELVTQTSNELITFYDARLKDYTNVIKSQTESYKSLLDAVDEELKKTGSSLKEELEKSLDLMTTEGAASRLLEEGKLGSSPVPNVSSADMSTETFCNLFGKKKDKILA